MNPVEFDLFVGRFHPLVVHLPIGFIIMTILLEIAGRFKKEPSAIKIITWLCYPAAVLASIISVASGLLLSDHRIYYPDALTTHKWLGIATLLLVSLAWLIKLKYGNLSRVKFYLISLSLITVLSFTGHYGGVLTHGENYLYEFAPKFLQKVFGNSTKYTKDYTIIHADSIVVYRDFIHPILQKKCIGCHNSQDSYGDFNASNYEDLFRPSDEGTPIVPENINSSELFTRISLPSEDSQFMPPRGEHMSYSEILILKYWIETGADSLARFEYNSMNKELVEILLRDYNLDYSPKPYYEKIKADSIDNQLITAFSENGYALKYLSEGNYFLDVQFVQDSLLEQQLLLLNDIKDNIAFLDFSKASFTDDNLSNLSELSNLIRLDIHGNPITDKGVKHLLALNHLESLNLFNTKITDLGLSELLSLPSLKNIYVWNSMVTDEEVNKLSQEFPHVKIDNGFAFDPALIPFERDTE